MSNATIWTEWADRRMVQIAQNIADKLADGWSIDRAVKVERKETTLAQARFAAAVLAGLNTHLDNRRARIGQLTRRLSFITHTQSGDEMRRLELWMAVNRKQPAVYAEIRQLVIAIDEMEKQT